MTEPDSPPLSPPGSADASPPSRRIRILIADDHAVVRTGLRMFLATHPEMEVVGEAASAAQTLEMAERLLPDVVLLDLVMPRGAVEPAAATRTGDGPESPGPAGPGAHGIDVIRTLRERVPRVRCLALTSFSDEDKLIPALGAGAAGYVLKDVTPEELIRAIQAVASGQLFLSGSVAGAVVRRATTPPQPAPSPLDRLTPRQREVLRCLAEGLSNAEIARRLYLTEATVKSHVGSILRKIGAADRTQAAVLAVRYGLSKTEEDRP